MQASIHKKVNVRLKLDPKTKKAKAKEIKSKSKKVAMQKSKTKRKKVKVELGGLHTSSTPHTKPSKNLKTHESNLNIQIKISHHSYLGPYPIKPSFKSLNFKHQTFQPSY